MSSVAEDQLYDYRSDLRYVDRCHDELADRLTKVVPSYREL